MSSGSHMDARRIYYLTVVHLFKCFFYLGPRAVNRLQALRYLNPALVTLHLPSDLYCRASLLPLQPSA